jgi:hypothetical protein
MGYKLEVESDGNLGIYSKPEGSHPGIWIGNILEPESPNPVLVLGTPLGILGVQRILDLFKKWKTQRHTASGTRQLSPRSARCRSPGRKWRRAYRAGK